MKINQISYLILFVVFMSSCISSNNHDIVNQDATIDIPRFQFIIDSIDAPDGIQSINFHNNTILLRTNNKTWCWNMSLELDSLKTYHFNRKKFEYIVNYHDSLIAATVKYNRAYYYVLDSGFKWKSLKTPDINTQKLIWQEPYLLEDSLYHIYACCKGEFGGMLYFKNKITGKTTASMMTCVSQLLKFEDAYFVSEYLAHMGTTSSLYKIKDPEKLNAYPSDTLLCSHWAEARPANDKWDSLYKEYSKGLDTLFEGDYDSVLTKLFIYQSQLLGFIHGDRCEKTFLSRYQDGRLTIIDTLPAPYFSKSFKNMYQAGNELWFDNSTYSYKSIVKLSNDTFRIYYLK